MHLLKREFYLEEAFWFTGKHNFDSWSHFLGGGFVGGLDPFFKSNHLGLDFVNKAETASLRRKAFLYLDNTINNGEIIKIASAKTWGKRG